jgi:hypothetical protein
LILIEALCKYRACGDIREDEIILIIELDGIITYDLDHIYILGITIGCYAIPVTRRLPSKFGGGVKIEIAQTSTGLTHANDKRMNVRADFLHGVERF